MDRRWNGRLVEEKERERELQEDHKERRRKDERIVKNGPRKDEEHRCLKDEDEPVQDLPILSPFDRCTQRHGRWCPTRQ